MITEDYVSFETAKLLKEKGFDEETRCYYPIKGDATGRLMFGSEYNHNHSQVQISAPTLQMAMKWLLVTHHLLITTFSSSQESWMYRITKPHQRLEDGVYGEDYETREDAIEAAIKHCLEKLI